MLQQRCPLRRLPLSTRFKSLFACLLAFSEGGGRPLSLPTRPSNDLTRCPNVVGGFAQEAHQLHHIFLWSHLLHSVSYAEGLGEKIVGLTLLFLPLPTSFFGPFCHFFEPPPPVSAIFSTPNLPPFHAFSPRADCWSILFSELCIADH